MWFTVESVQFAYAMIGVSLCFAYVATSTIDLWLRQRRRK